MYIRVLSLVVAGGCMAEAPELSSTELHVETSNRISLNRISLNRISLNRISLNRIALDSLSLASSASQALLATAEDRELLAYVVQCALPDGDAITLTGANGTYTFDGAIGLAPQWTSEAMTEAEKRWVSACLLARTNAFGVSVTISMRGPSPALATNAAEMSAFDLVEGAFWGNVFGDELEAYACQGPIKLPLRLDGFSVSPLPRRACTLSADGVHTTCGHTYAGPCASSCTWTNGSYTNCAGNAEVVTTYLASH